ncbi:MAG: helix-turn-helix domain-containing protein [Oscillospiraceae bacterium]|nr:helix-turn-helix domain-containing protein [Oscillospiraceae bacterium]
MNVSMEMLAGKLGLPVARTRRGEDWDALCLTGWSVAEGGPHTLRLAPADDLEEAAPDGPLLLAGAPAAMPETGRSVLALACDLPALTDGVNRFFLGIRRLETELLRAAYADRSIQRLTELMGELFGGRLAVLSTDLQVLGICEGTDPAGELGRSLAEELAQVMNGEAELAGTRGGTEPFVLEKGAFGKDCLCLNVFHQGVPVCILVHFEVDPEPPRYCRELLRELGQYVQAVYEAAGETHSLPSDRLYEIASELLSGGKPRRENVEFALQFRGWPAEGPFLCGEILPSQGDVFNRTLSYYCRAIGKAVPNTYTMEDRGRILCIVFLEPFGGTVDGFMEQNVEFLRDSNFLAGFSNVFTDFMELPAACRQAQIALRMGMRVRPTIWYHRFSDMVMPYLWDCMTAELKAEDLCAPQLLRLQQYDEQNGTEYTRTLACYLKNALNAAGTAKELFIHRGTMNYRLSRIREMTGLAPEDPETRLYLELSLGLMRHKGQGE